MNQRCLVICMCLLLLAFASPASAWEMTNLYDAFGADTSGTVKDFGFSAFIRYEGKTILFDAGTNADILKQNAEAQGIDLGEVDFAIASHAHTDHIGGFDYLLSVNPDVKIYFPDDFFGAGGPLEFNIAGREPDIGSELPPELQYFDGTKTSARLESNGRFYKAVEYIDSSMQVAPGVHLIATSSPYIGYFTKYPGTDLAGRPTPDTTAAKTIGLPELSLALETDEGTVLVVGCSHSTVTVIVEATQDRLDAPVEMLAGGFHLLPYDRETIEGTASRLRNELQVKRVAPAHCTGHLGFLKFRDVYQVDYEIFGLGATIGSKR